MLDRADGSSTLFAAQHKQATAVEMLLLHQAGVMQRFDIGRLNGYFVPGSCPGMDV